MIRTAPLALILLLAAAAWRREVELPRAAVRRPPVRLRLEGGPAPDEASATGSRGEAVERERHWQEHAVRLEAYLRETEEKLDATRAKLAKAVAGSVEGRLRVELDYSRQREARLQAEMERLETSYVEMVARLRRSD